GIGAITHSVMLDYKPKALISLTMKSINSFQGRMEYLYETLKYYKENKYKTVIIAGSEARAKNLIRQLSDEEISADYAEVLKVLPPNGGVTVTHGSIQKGFEYPLIRTAIIGDREIFGGERKKRTRHLASKGDKLQSFTDLNQGDFIVHQNYGIGQYVGIEQLSVAGIRKDYLKINYKGDDVLYVPTDQLDMVYKHISKDGVRIKLNHLGGGDWTKTKQRVKAAAADMAKELIALYAERSQIKGIPFSKDSEWQKEFEESFPYDETDDQLRSIEEVKSDMEKPQPMDRLLCGDVGYGKTEVAIRAAFKAVTDGYQVAYLVPTTILASQHYNTFKQRMKDYPINISLMSRFCTPVQQKKTLKELAVGEVDILIGTHKILGKSVKFDKLGLLIIDEEQRFGVGHKEKIKEIRKEIDVLTLSATPIPRTLHMSLTGIRDMSIINQPPSERLPVATYVLEYNDDVVREAINREMGRGGQVYYLFNRVEGIYKAATKIAELVPDARVAVAHGRMNERELEEIMLEVSEGELDVLVCTTIIETGLDIPNVNTIIIEDADRLGLAQLYQLRGRVGRSNRLAYAYLTFRRDKVLSEIAEKRLLAIKEFTEFGSGFKIAMRDLEIRGTGNLIGAKQHGHMDAVGYDMYCRLLEEAVLEEQGIEKPKKTETLIDLPVSAYIPESYIPSHAQRISAYKRIAAINTADDLFDTYDEIEDRYGTVPNVTDALMKISLIKAYAENFGVSEMIATEDKVIFKFDENNIPDMRRCIDMLIKNPNDFHITNSSPPRMQYNLKREKTDVNGDKYLNSLKETMEKLTLC
ncbi:MAG: transcription-repair coupling factor, partial [Oscillospiraceae bacterium]